MLSVKSHDSRSQRRTLMGRNGGTSLGARTATIMVMIKPEAGSIMACLPACGPRRSPGTPAA